MLATLSGGVFADLDPVRAHPKLYGMRRPELSEEFV